MFYQFALLSVLANIYFVFKYFMGSIDYCQHLPSFYSQEEEEIVQSDIEFESEKEEEKLDPIREECSDDEECCDEECSDDEECCDEECCDEDEENMEEDVISDSESKEDFELVK